MARELVANYYALGLLGLAALAFAVLSLVLSAMVGPRQPESEKLDPYESGMWPIGDARGPFPVKFYVVAMLFMLFALEATFLFPWAAVLKDRLPEWPGLGLYGLVEMGIFLAILVVGYLCIWRRGAFDWQQAEPPFDGAQGGPTRRRRVTPSGGRLRPQVEGPPSRQPTDPTLQSPDSHLGSGRSTSL